LWNRLVPAARPKPWTAVIAWPLAAAAATVSLVRLLGLDRIPPLVQLIAFTPYLTLACAVAAVLIGLTRRPAATGIAAVATLSLLAVVVPRTVGSPGAGDGEPLVVMSANLRLGGADPTSIVELVRDARVDVLALQELTEEAEEAFLARGLAEALPHHESHPGPAASGTAIYSRLPLTSPGVRSVSPVGFAQAYATVTLNDRPVIIESVHPVPPSSIRLTAYWLTGLGNQLPADAPGAPRILAGDFNATVDHHAMRAVLATGYRDAADAVGAGLTPTWPYYGRRSLVTPKVALDHILVPDGMGVRDFRVVTIPRSDHRAIIATVLIP
jgi:endonuclease/exonuclease/phosphatase (EEP) superfamily protein YafD